MGAYDDWAVVPHDKGDAPAVARALIALADHAREVVWVPGRNEFLTPDHVAEKYRKSLIPPARKRAPRTKKENNDG